MLIYDPALDPYHSAIRILAIAIASENRKIALSIDAARIADYFLVYPYKMANFKFPAEFRTIRAAVKEAENPYRHTSGDKVAFERMRPVFFSALSGLVAAELIDATKQRLGFLSLTGNIVPDDLASAVARFQKRQTVIGKFVLSDFLAIPINGNNGIKHRSGLIEHRYDIV